MLLFGMAEARIKGPRFAKRWTTQGIWIQSGARQMDHGSGTIRTCCEEVGPGQAHKLQSGAADEGFHDMPATSFPQRVVIQQQTRHCVVGLESLAKYDTARGPHTRVPQI